MKYKTLRYLFLAFVVVLMHACGEDDASLIDGLPDSIINTDPEGSPPRALTENWNGHDEELIRQNFTTPVAVYYDPEVNREITWPFEFYTNAWGYVTRTYGSFGPNNYLYVVGHGEDKSTFIKTYLEEDAGKRNIIDFPILNTEITPEVKDTSISLMGELVETGSNGVFRSPAAAIWQTKFQEIFLYDFYLANDMQSDADRVKAQFLGTSVNYPSSDSFWFRDWFLPIYENYQGAATLRRFFNLLAEKYPINGTAYQGDMTIGEFVHFFSGAAGVSLKQMFEDAFGWDDDRARELLIAQAKFPIMPYSFPPASQIIDVTSEGNAEIYVTSEYGGAGGRDGNEGSPKVIDGDYNTKFLTGGFPKDFYMQQNLNAPLIVNKYVMVSGNDAPDRDFRSWELQGSNDGTNFTSLHKVDNENFTARNQEKTYDFENTTAYKHYRLVLFQNNGGGLIQLSEWRLLRLELVNFDPVDVTGGATITVSRDYSGGATGSEGSLKLIDGDKNSKFLTGGFSGGVSADPLVITLELAQAEPVNYYEWTSGDDAPERDPKKWTVEGSTDGTTWIELDSRDQADRFDARKEDYPFRFTNTTSYLYYRWTITENFGGDPFQASELRLFKE